MTTEWHDVIIAALIVGGIFASIATIVVVVNIDELMRAYKRWLGVRDCAFCEGLGRLRGRNCDRCNGVGAEPPAP